VYCISQLFYARFKIYTSIVFPVLYAITLLITLYFFLRFSFISINYTLYFFEDLISLGDY